MKCDKCGFESPAEMHFCGKCGCELIASSDLPGQTQSFEEKLARLEGNLPPLAEIIRARKGKVEGKPREMTIMFCGLKESTRPTQKFGPEETFIVVRNVHHWEGMVSPTSEDGILAVFGAVDELEDATQRAIGASIAIHKDIADFRKRTKHDPRIPPVLLRIGINTGTVVIDAVGTNFRVRLKPEGDSDTIDMAYGLEALAEPGTTYVTEETYRLTKHLFHFQPLGKKMVKSKEQPISVYKVLSAKKDLSTYQSCKAKMKTGDLLQWRENCLFMWLWRSITRSKLNHSSMVLRLREYEKFPRNRFTTESRVHGTVLNRLSHRIYHYDGEVWWYPLKDDWDPCRQKIGEEMLELIGIPYDLAGILKITFRRLFGAKCRKVGDMIGLKLIVSWMRRREQNEVFCSEYCYWVYEESTRNLPNKPEMNKLSELPLPDDIETLGIFKKEEKIL